jgi:hypothetical protein
MPPVVNNPINQLDTTGSFSAGIGSAGSQCVPVQRGIGDFFGFSAVGNLGESVIPEARHVAGLVENGSPGGCFLIWSAPPFLEFGVSCHCDLITGKNRGTNCLYGCECTDGSLVTTPKGCSRIDKFAGQPCPLKIITERTGEIPTPIPGVTRSNSKVRIPRDFCNPDGSNQP